MELRFMRNGYVTVLGSNVRLEPVTTLLAVVKSRLQVLAWLRVRLMTLVRSVAASFSVRPRLSRACDVVIEANAIIIMPIIPMPIKV